MKDRAQDGVGDAARSRFERAVHDLPAATSNRLRLARRDALAGNTPGRRRAGWAIPVGATAALLLGIAWWRQAPAPGPAPGVALPSVTQASASRNPGARQAGSSVVELPSEDEAELYAWIADTPVASDAQGGAL